MSLPRIQTFAALEDRAFRQLFIGMCCSFISLAMQNLVRGYIAFQITGSSASIGIMLVAWGFPMMVFSLAAGTLADRIPKRTIMVGTQVVMVLSTVVAAFVVQMGWIQLWHLLLLGVVQGISFGFNLPTRQAVVAEITPPPKLANAVALTNASLGLSNVAGPPIAGALIAVSVIGEAGVLYLSAAIYMVVVFLYGTVPTTTRPKERKASFVGDLKSGLRYVGTSKVLPLILVVGYLPWMVAVPYQSMMPAFSAEILHVDSRGLGILIGAIGIGALCGSLFVASIATSPHKKFIQFWCGITFAVALFLFGLSPWFGLSCFLLFFSGGASNAYMALNQAEVAARTDPAYFGRVFAIASLIHSLGPIAGLPYGWFMDTVGMRQTITSSAIGIFVLIIGGLVFRPGFWTTTVEQPEVRGNPDPVPARASR